MPLTQVFRKPHVTPLQQFGLLGGQQTGVPVRLPTVPAGQHVDARDIQRGFGQQYGGRRPRRGAHTCALVLQQSCGPQTFDPVGHWHTFPPRHTWVPPQQMFPQPFSPVLQQSDVFELAQNSPCLQHS